MQGHTFYSIRTGINKNTKGLSLAQLKSCFSKVYQELCKEGFFDESFGWSCVDLGEQSGKIFDIKMEILLAIRKEELWPIEWKLSNYSEDDFFDIIEFLHIHISKPIDGSYHSYNDCGMHWETFNKKEGQAIFREKINPLLNQYENPFELSVNGMLLEKPEAGFEKIFEADIPSQDENIIARINSATLLFRRHGSTQDNRRQAVRDLADVLEYLKPKCLPNHSQRGKWRLRNYCFSNSRCTRNQL